ncbi:MAG: DegV family protein [Phototrophicaceae bacterium]
MRIYVVTDSSASFAHPQLVAHSPLVVVPCSLRIGKDVYRDNIDLNTHEAIDRMARSESPPALIPPDVADFVATYTRLATVADVIISIHPSAHLSQSYQNALIAAQRMHGYIAVHVLDCGTIGMAQGMVIRATLRAIERQTYNDIEDLVTYIRAKLERIYSAFYVESTDFLMRNHILSASHALLCKIHGMKPIITVEDGKMKPMEKVRNRAQGIECLVEFVTEFERFEDVLLVQPRSYMTDETRLLHDRLALEFPGKYFQYAIYSSSVATLIGCDATGVVVMEPD